MKRSVLNFDNYFLIREQAETAESKSAKTVSEVISLFFKTYMFLAAKVPGYKEVADDIVEVNEEKDPEKRGKAMETVINKVADKVDKKYEGLKEEVKKVSKTIGELFNTVASSEDAKKEASAINKLISKKLMGYQEIVNKSSGKTSESRFFSDYEQFVYPLLFEKNTFEDERKDLISQMKSIYAEMQSQQKNPSSDALKSKAEEVIKKFDEMAKLLQDDKAWGEMKRKERKEKLSTMNDEVKDIITKTNELQKSELAKIGVDKKVAETMASVLASVNSMVDKANEIDAKEIEAPKKEEGKKDEGKKEGDYKEGETVKYKRDNGEEAEGEITKIEGDKVFFKDASGKEFSKDKKDITGKSDKKEDKKEESKETDIKSGIEDKANIKKDGPNSKAITEFQKTYNSLEMGKKIAEDGAYGKDTEKAVSSVAKMIKALTGKEIKSEGGKILSADLQKSIKKLLDNKDKIKGILG